MSAFVLDLRPSDAPLLVAAAFWTLRPSGYVRDEDVARFPSAAWSVTAEGPRVVAVGELTSDAWDALADVLAQLVDEQAVDLDLSLVAHARTMPPRPAGYLRILAQHESDVVVRASPYVRACIQASRWGCEIAVRWEVP